MLTHRFYKALIFCGIIIVFAAGCRSPEIIFPTGDITINAGESISFSAASYPDAIHKWTFDGGAKDTFEQNPKVTFNRPGVYYVHLFVLYNDFESGFAFRKVTVDGTSRPAPVEKTGQTTSYATGDDGDLEKGVAWPNPRFTDNSDGTVTDNLTGLIWLKSANCFGLRTWSQALSDCNSLASGSCGLTDGSSAGDWRLPNVKELHSLIDYGQYAPALPSGHPFTNVQSSSCWSATTYAFGTGSAWLVRVYAGNVYHNGESLGNNVWPVRSGQ
jgi:PKD repeat protein